MFPAMSCQLLIKRYSCGDHLLSDASLSKWSKNEGAKRGDLVPFPVMESYDGLLKIHKKLHNNSSRNPFISEGFFYSELPFVNIKSFMLGH